MKLHEFDNVKDRIAAARRNFEHILFGDLKGTEKDTKVESEIYMAIYDFIDDPNDEAKAEALGALTYLDKFKDLFPGDLRPQANMAHRGTNISYKKFKSSYKDFKYDKHGMIDVGTYYTPRSAIQSWTTNIDIARKFANTPEFGYHGDSESIPVIVSVDVDDTFILNSTITNLISNSIHHQNEYEIIRISKKPIPCTLSMKVPMDLRNSKSD